MKYYNLYSTSQGLVLGYLLETERKVNLLRNKTQGKIENKLFKDRK